LYIWFVGKTLRWGVCRSGTVRELSLNSQSNFCRELTPILTTVDYSNASYNNSPIKAAHIGLTSPAYKKGRTKVVLTPRETLLTDMRSGNRCTLGNGSSTGVDRAADPRLRLRLRTL